MPVKLYQRVVHTTSLPSNLQLHLFNFCERSADYVRYQLLACKKCTVHRLFGVYSMNKTGGKKIVYN